MVTYFLLFFAIGICVGKFVEKKIIALGLMLGIAALWGASHRAIWGMVTLGELLFGYFLYDILIARRSPPNSDGNI